MTAMVLLRWRVCPLTLIGSTVNRMETGLVQSPLLAQRLGRLESGRDASFGQFRRRLGHQQGRAYTHD